MSSKVELQPFRPPPCRLEDVLPDWARTLGDLQKAIPELAKGQKKLADLEYAVGEIDTLHRSVRGDARALEGLLPNTVHLVLTSPPYWTLKQYRESDGQNRLRNV